MRRTVVETPSDEVLVDRAREGDTESFAELWRRHSAAANRAAYQFRSVADPDDLVSEAYLRILSAVRAGKGPTGAFRPYLFVTVRNLVNRRSHDPRDLAIDDFDAIADDAAPADPSVAALDRSLTVRAFRSLPENWQTVLWYSEVEGMRPREFAPLVGLSANGAAALAYRARDGLRTAWIQAHVNEDSTPDECKWTLSHMGAYTRGTLSARDQRRADDHIRGCTRCMIVSAEIEEIGSRLTFVLLPITLGGIAAAGYRSATQAASATAAAHPRTGQSMLAGGTGWVIGAGAAIAAVAAATVGIVSVLPQDPPPSDTVAAQPATPAVERPSPAPGPELPVPSPPTTAQPPSADGAPDLPPSAPPASGPTPPPVVAPPPVVTPPPVVVPPPVVTPPPVDSSADAPAVLTVFGSVSLVRPSLHGLAEPLATIVVTDQAGTVMATVIADGEGKWSTGQLTALSPATTALSVTQTDQAGNVSPATELAPLAFHPEIGEPLDGSAITLANPGVTLVPIAVFGWSDGELVVTFDGTPVPNGHEEYRGSSSRPTATT